MERIEHRAFPASIIEHRLSSDPRKRVEYMDLEHVGMKRVGMKRVGMKRIEPGTH